MTSIKKRNEPNRPACIERFDVHPANRADTNGVGQAPLPPGPIDWENTKMTDTAQAREKLSADFRQVMDDVDALMKATTDKAEGEAVALRARIRERLDTAKERLADVQYEAVDKAKKAAHATDDYVHTHPWQAVGIGAAVGVVLGMLIGRK